MSHKYDDDAKRAMRTALLIVGGFVSVLVVLLLWATDANAGSESPQLPVGEGDCFYQLTDSGHGVAVVGDDVIEIFINTYSGRWSYTPPFSPPLRGPGDDFIVGVKLICEDEEAPPTTTPTTTTVLIPYPTLGPTTTTITTTTTTTVPSPPLIVVLTPPKAPSAQPTVGTPRLTG